MDFEGPCLIAVFTAVQETTQRRRQTKSNSTSDRSCFADLFALFFFYLCFFSPCHAIYKQHGVTRLTYTPCISMTHPVLQAPFPSPLVVATGIDAAWMKHCLFQILCTDLTYYYVVHQELAMQQTSSIGCFETIKQTQKKVYRNIIHLCARRVVACFYYRI